MALGASQGQTLGYVQESALGTNGGGFGEIRYQENVEFPTSTRTGVMNPNRGHAHPFNFSDKPIFIEKFQEGALSFSTFIRRDASSTMPIADFFESAGCVVASTTASTVASYASTVAFDLGDSGAAYGAVGNAVLVQLSDDTYYPVLVSAKATDTITPGMAIPSITANGKTIAAMTTIYPRSRPVVATKSLAFEFHSRATHTTGEDLAYELQGCALNTIGELVLTPSTPPVMQFSFTVGKIDQKTDAIAEETFVCSEAFAIVNDNFKFETAASSAAGGIARGDGILKEAKIAWGFKGVPVIGEGSGVFAGIQGYILQADGMPKITITGEFTKDYWTALEGTNTSQYIGLIQPTTSTTVPAFGFWAPNCHLDPETPPVVDFNGDSYVVATATYICTSAGYDSDTLPEEAGAAPWYFAIGGSAS